MQLTKRALLAAGLLFGAAAMTGCTAAITPVSTPAPKTQKVTAQPAQTAGTETAPGGELAGMGEKTAGPLHLLADGHEVDQGAVTENGLLLLPLAGTAEALGWKAQEEKTEEDAQQKRVVTLEKEESRITVSWTVSDNTARNIVWQKDGLLIPVDTYITTVDGAAYVPAAFFEEAMGAMITHADGRVTAELPAPKDTPEKQEQQLEGNG